MDVSICMITYGHEKFIQQAIESVLEQDVDFDIELIIANDCSPDKTDAVIRNIINTHARAPRIRYIRHDKNLGMMGNFYFALGQCTGSYIAFCEGDDYWTDTKKLQKQKDYLDTHPGVALVHTSYQLLYEQSGEMVEKKKSSMDYDTTDGCYNALLRNNFIATLTAMVVATELRKALQALEKQMPQWPMGDYPLWLYLATGNKLQALEDYTAVYRFLPQSASHSSSLKKNLYFIKKVFEVRWFFIRKIKMADMMTVIHVCKSRLADTMVYLLKEVKMKSSS